MLDVRHLQIVEAIAKAGTVTAAARRLHLTQPAVSHALSDLEAKLGVALFRREPRGMVITPEGSRLLETAGIVLAAIHEAETDLRLRKDGYRGVVHLATECYTCYHWLPAILAHFQTRFPDVDLKIATDATSNPVAALLDERLDLAIMHNPVSSKELITEDLFTDELVLAVSPGHPLADRGWIEPADLADQVLILHADPGTSSFVTDFLEPAGVHPLRILELRLTEAVTAAVKAGLGVTVMAHWALRPEFEAGALRSVRVGEAGLHRAWQLVTHRNRAGRATIQELARLLKKESVMIPVGGAA